MFTASNNRQYYEYYGGILQIHHIQVIRVPEDFPDVNIVRSKTWKAVVWKGLSYDTTSNSYDKWNCWLPLELVLLCSLVRFPKVTRAESGLKEDTENIQRCHSGVVVMVIELWNKII